MASEKINERFVFLFYIKLHINKFNGEHFLTKCGIPVKETLKKITRDALCKPRFICSQALANVFEKHAIL